MAIFRGTGGSGSSSDSTIVDAVTAQATIATTKAGEASTSATTATTKASEASTSATTASTKATEASTSASTASTKATEANTAKTGAETAQTAAEAARDAALGHSNTANSSAVQTVAGSNTQVVGVYNNIANVNTVAGVNTDVTTVAGISSDVTTVASDASDIGTVSTNIANVNNVGNNIANVNAVHGNASNINTVAADGTDIGTVATNIANVNTVAGISSNVTTVAGLESKMDTVIADASDIGAVAGNIGDVTTVAGINSDVDTVAGIAAKVTTVADNITDVQNADTNATNAASSASNASASATSASNSATTATTKATEASNSATAASNSATTATAKASQAAGSATTAGTSASTATTKASEASASATTATTKAGEAASSASAASGSATTATTKASEASASAASASTSATNATNASSTWNNFYTSYLGTSDAQPSVDVLGNAIVAGALYYDTGAGSNTVGLYVYNGSSWVYSTNYNNVTAPYSLAQDLSTNGNDISFGDNDKAKFGASDDLQISHVTTNSRNLIRTNTDSELMFHHDSSNVGSSDEVVVGQFVANTEANNQGFRSILSLQHSTANANKAGRIVVESNSSFSNSVNMYLQTGHSTSVAPRDRIKIANNGDISFFEDTGTTAKLFWDASAESLGIGTTSPSALLHLQSTNPVIRLTDSDTGADSIISASSSAGALSISADNGNEVNNTFINFKTDGSEKMRIQSDGNVGIGTSSPDKLLDLESSTNPTVRLSSSKSGSFTANEVMSSLEFHSADTSGVGAGVRSAIRSLATDTFGSRTELTFSVTGVSSDTEAMRIDSNGHVIVPEGITLGTAVGTYNAANTLDDYEEGTWTPILYGDTSGVSSPLSFGAVSSSYTKVGRLVYFNAYITNVVASGHSLTGEFRIAGLPFASSKHSPIDSITYGDLFSFDDLDTTVGGYVSSGSTFISVRKGSSKGAVSTSELENSNVKDLMISGTYVA